MRKRVNITKIDKMFIVCLLLVISLFSSVKLVSSADYDNNAIVWLVPSSTSVEIGDDFNVTIYVDSSGTQCSMWEITLLTYNETQLWMTNTTGFQFLNIWDSMFADATPHNNTGKYTNIGSFITPFLIQ